MLRSLTRRAFLRVSSIVASSAATGGFLAACASPPAAETKPAAPAADATKPAAQPTTGAAATQAPAAQAPAAQAPATQAPVAKAPVAAPAVIQTVNLKMQSTWPTVDIVHEIFVDWGKKVEEMAGPRVKIDILPAGAVVPAFQLIDAVHQGVLDGGHGVPAYWFGKNKAASLWGTGPSFGLDADGMLGWVNYGGGQELYNELMQQQLNLNVVSFFHGPIPTQPLGWFQRPITGPNDFQGMKFRTVGMSTDLFQEMGASVVALPGGEIVPALERNVIDSAEFNNPTSDKILGFPDVRKTFMLQSYHQPVEYLELLVNKQKFDGLADDLKAIVKYANMAQSADYSWKMMDRNSKDLVELKERYGVRVERTPQSVLQAQLQAWDRIVERESQASPFFAKVVESQRAWAARVAPLRIENDVENETAYRHYFPQR